MPSMATPRPFPYKLEEVLPTDYEEIAQLENTVFEDDPLTVYAYGPSRASPANIAHRVKSLSSKPRGCEVRMRKVVDPETGVIVGFSYWKFFYEPWIVNPEPVEKNEKTNGTNGDKAKNEPNRMNGEKAVNGVNGLSKTKENGDVIRDGDGMVEEKEKSASIWPEGANVELCEKAFVGADKIRERIYGGKRHAALNILVILKSHQRRGIGKMMLKDGLDEADEHNLPCWLGSSEPGFPLYEMNGFVTDEVMVYDMKKYGGDSTEKHIIMFRPALGKVEI